MKDFEKIAEKIKEFEALAEQDEKELEQKLMREIEKAEHHDWKAFLGFIAMVVLFVAAYMFEEFGHIFGSGVLAGWGFLAFLFAFVSIIREVKERNDED
jgi:hypothetical protein